MEPDVGPISDAATDAADAAAAAALVTLPQPVAGASGLSVLHWHECTCMHCADRCSVICLGNMHAAEQRTRMSGAVLGHDVTLPAR